MATLKTKISVKAQNIINKCMTENCPNIGVRKDKNGHAALFCEKTKAALTCETVKNCNVTHLTNFSGARTTAKLHEEA